MHRTALKYVFLLTSAFMAVSACGNSKNSVQFEWGNNIWGNSVGFTYQRWLTKNIGASVGFQRGYIHFDIKGGERFFTFKNSGNDAEISMDFKQIVDLNIIFRIKEGRKLRLFNTWGLGLSHYFVTFRYSYTDLTYSGIFRATKDISKYALYTSFNIVEYRPNLERPIKFAFGIKTRIAFMKSPLVLISENVISGIQGMVRFKAVAPFKTLVIPYPEMYIRVGYLF